MLVIIGTVPLTEQIYQGEARFEGKDLLIGGYPIPVERGTGALAAAALRIMEQVGSERPYCLLAGDESSGNGSTRLLAETVRFLPSAGAQVAVFHYMYVLLKFAGLLKEAIASMPQKPSLIGDAGGMYLAKAGGIASIFDIFTPDMGELAFLADPKALHPMYTKPEYFRQEADRLAITAWNNSSSPPTLVVKGKVDRVFQHGDLVSAVSEPSIRAMEAVGGTGDTVTGILAAFQYLKVARGIPKALLLNRLAGEKTGCTPRTQIGEFISNLELSLLEKAGEAY